MIFLFTIYGYIRHLTCDWFSFFTRRLVHLWLSRARATPRSSLFFPSIWRYWVHFFRFLGLYSPGHERGKFHEKNHTAVTNPFVLTTIAL